MLASSHPAPSTTFELDASRQPWSPTGARPTCIHARTMRGVVDGAMQTICTDCKMIVSVLQPPRPARTWVFRAKCFGCGYINFEAVHADTGTGRPPIAYSGLLGECHACHQACEATWEAPDGTPYMRGNMVLISELSR